MKTIAIIPKPAKMKVLEGTFTLTPQTIIVITEDTRFVGQYLAELLAPATGFNLDVIQSSQTKEPGNCIILSSDCSKDHPDPEGYELKVLKDQVLIQAQSSSGIFYGSQTLRQLLPPAIESKEKVDGVAWTIPQVEIEDTPRYKWRGMHLDVVRHFFDKEFVKKYIDLMALYKMNRFHWHLTDDHGWRIEIKKYPKLTEVGSWRYGGHGEFVKTNPDPEAPTAEKYGGFYTQNDVREIVEYARQRFITVVPEIEMPGHSIAALAAYPQLSCTGGPFEIWTGGGISSDVFCAGNEDTLEFLQNVLVEVMELFSGKYIHIGGDECLKDRWKQCEKCQARIKTEKLSDEDELQSYFIKRISGFLAANNRTPIGWDEIIEGGLAQQATVMSWRGTKGGIVAARSGHKVVMTPKQSCYFNYRYPNLTKGAGQPSEAISPKKVYSYEPTPAELTPQEAVYIQGAQGCLWTEPFSTESEVEFALFPRMCALAEVVWSQRNSIQWNNFRERLRAHGIRLEKIGVNFYRDPLIWPEVKLTNSTRDHESNKS